MKINSLIIKSVELLKTVIRKGALNIIVASFIEKFVAFFGTIFVVRFLSKEDYSVYTYAYNFFSYAVLLSGLGLTYAILRYVLLTDEIEEKLGHVNFALRFGTIFNIILTLGTVMFSLFFIYPEGYEQTRTILSIMAIAIPFKYILSTMLCLDRAMMSTKRYASVTLINSAVVIVSRVASAYFGGIVTIAVTYVVCEVIMVAIYYRWTKAYYFKGVTEKRLEPEQKKSMLAYSIQYMITNGIWAIFMLNETSMLGALSNDLAAVADFKVAYTIPASLSIFTTAIGIFVGPYFTKWERNSDYSAFRRGLIYTVSAGVGVLILVVAGVIAFGGVVIPFLFGEKYSNVIPLTNILLFAALANSTRSLVANIFAAIGKIHINLIIAISGVIMQIVVGILIIPTYGSYGLAYVDILIYSAMAIAEAIFVLSVLKQMQNEHSKDM